MKRALLVLLVACGGARTPVRGDSYAVYWETVGGVRWSVVLEDRRFAVGYVDGTSLVTLANGDHPTSKPAPEPEPEAMPSAVPTDLHHMPAIEQADLDFAADTAKDGAAGWARHFDEHGAMWQGGHRIEGDAITQRMTKTLAAGSLTWRPVTSGARGDLGFSLGTAEFTEPGGKPEHLTYCTIWKHQADGSWKVLFDIGRPAT